MAGAATTSAGPETVAARGLPPRAITRQAFVLLACAGMAFGNHPRSRGSMQVEDNRNPAHIRRWSATANEHYGGGAFDKRAMASAPYHLISTGNKKAGTEGLRPKVEANPQEGIEEAGSKEDVGHDKSFGPALANATGLRSEALAKQEEGFGEANPQEGVGPDIQPAAPVDVAAQGAQMRKDKSVDACDAAFKPWRTELAGLRNAGAVCSTVKSPSLPSGGSTQEWRLETGSNPLFLSMSPVIEQGQDALACTLSPTSAGPWLTFTAPPKELFNVVREDLGRCFTQNDNIRKNLLRRLQKSAPDNVKTFRSPGVTLFVQESPSFAYLCVHWPLGTLGRDEPLQAEDPPT